MLAFIVVLATLCSIAMGQGDPAIRVNVKKITVVNKESDMMGKWESRITKKDPLNEVGITVKVLKPVPANLMMKLNLKLAGSELPEYELPACEALDDKIIGKDFVAKGHEFPKKCPIGPGTYLVDGYTVKPDNLPPGLPDGEVTGTITFYVPDGKDIVVLDVVGDIYHAVPSIG